MSEHHPILRLFFVVPMFVFFGLLGCTTESATPSAHQESALPAIETAPKAASLVGELLLPGKGGRRGVEVHAWVADPDGEVHQLWIFPESDGRFERELSGQLTGVGVVAGSEVYRIDAVDLPIAGDDGAVDLGVIDLRDALVVRRVRTRMVDGIESGMVRIGLWIGPPHTGPSGELPSLGSKQFPSMDLGREVEWLLPVDAGAVYFLVEYADSPDLTSSWRSERQQLFGPFESSDFPLELLLD